MSDQPLYGYLRRAYGAEVVLPAARASLGLMASLRAWLDLGHAPVVALSANVCHDVVAAILASGLRPVFLDQDPVTGLVPDGEWRRARAAGASVALVVHLYGNPSDVSAARAHFPADESLLIDDAAQALGAHNSAGLAGAQGDVGLLSFGATKHISAGGAVVLLRSGCMAALVQKHLDAIPVLPSGRVDAMHHSFRIGLEAARRRLRDSGGNDVAAFNGLLEGYVPLVSEPLDASCADAVWLAMASYDRMREARCAKAAAWADELSGSGMVPVGMLAGGAVPWRYACRLPGLDWASQHRIAESMRSRAMNVSHWYLPAHWMCGAPVASLAGVEQLAREMFQFWLDESISMENIRQGATIVKKVLEECRS